VMVFSRLSLSLYVTVMMVILRVLLLVVFISIMCVGVCFF
jgi:hypothetical protein